jgi:dTDP-4-amino-4,6-dideoxygalactose transaminase
MIPRFSPTVTLCEILAFQCDALRIAGNSTEETREFEKAFAEHLGAENALFVSSGRMALWLLLQALDYPPGSEVILPGFTFFAIPAVVRLAGLKPVYADISPDTYELSPQSVTAVLSERTRAIIPTHLFGRTCDMEEIHQICDARGIDIIEDCAQSMGAEIGDKKAGCLGTASYFTFGITKNFTTFGGGMVVCPDHSIHERILNKVAAFYTPGRVRLMKQAFMALAMRTATQRAIFTACLGPLLKAGGGAKPDFVQQAFQEDMSPLTDERLTRARWRPSMAQARAGLRQLKVVDAKNAARRERGRSLLEALSETERHGLPAPAAPGGDHIYVSFPITREDRYRFAHRLRLRGVDTATGYMSNCAGMPRLGGSPGMCPHSAYVADRIVHLPLSPDLSDRDVERIAAAVLAADGD